jgi:putative flippase GtrA
MTLLRCHDGAFIVPSSGPSNPARGLRQFIVYIMVGISSAVVDVGLMKLLTMSGVHYLLAANVGFVAGLGANFLMHSRLTFKAKYSHGALARYISVVLINYAITMLCINISHNWLEMPVLGKVISLPIISLNGFLLSKHWVYKQ